jgi:Nucleotide-diphospho-sugar transferase
MNRKVLQNLKLLHFTLSFIYMTLYGIKSKSLLYLTFVFCLLTIHIPADIWLLHIRKLYYKTPTDSRTHNISQKNAYISMLVYIQERKYHDFLIVISASRGHLRFLMNWIASFKSVVAMANQNSFVLVSLDNEMNHELVLRNISFISIDILLHYRFDLPSDEVIFNTKAYNRLTNAKIDVVLFFVRTLKLNVLFSDVDIVLTNELALKEIGDLLGNYTYDMFFSSDDFDKPDSLICTGFYAVRPSPFSVHFLESVSNMSRDGNQSEFNDQTLANRYWNSLNNSEKMKIYLLPLNKYINGQGLDRIRRRNKWKPLMIHANYRIGSLAKEKLLRRHKKWYID